MGEIRRFVQLGVSFAFETTLAGRMYLKLIPKLIKLNWRVDLIYFWLPSIELCQARVAERVAHGGHSIPESEIARRYPRSVFNLLNHYSPKCTSTICLDNSEATPKLIFTENRGNRIVEDQPLFEALVSSSLRGGD